MSSDTLPDAAPASAKGAPEESLGQQRTDLAYGRSVEAAERTLMAGVRTAVSMISFGFTIAKFFQYMGKLTVADDAAPVLGHAPHNLGLILLVGGTLTIVFSLFEYRSYLRVLEQSSGERMGAKTSLFSAAFILGVGIVLTAVLIGELVSS